MEYSGEILGIIYQNELNSYTIAEMYIEELEKVETIVGYLPFIVEGDNLKIIGKFVEHREYGEQFKVESFEKIMPQTLDSLERYLANGTIKGIGPSTAKKIVKKFRENTIETIKYAPEKLAEIKGITLEKAKGISESFIESWEVWQIVAFLEKFNIGVENAKRIYDKLGINAINKIKENPYILIDLVRGVEFRQIDNMALELGIEENSKDRIQSGIKYGLIQITYNGHSCALLQNLEEYTCNLLDADIESIEENIINLKAKGEIIIEEHENEAEWVYLESFYNTEVAICNRIIKLNKYQNSKYVKGIDQEIEKIEKNNIMELSDKQKEAVEAINNNNVTIITGGPGTRKNYYY